MAINHSIFALIALPFALMPTLFYFLTRLQTFNLIVPSWIILYCIIIIMTAAFTRMSAFHSSLAYFFASTFRTILKICCILNNGLFIMIQTLKYNFIIDLILFGENLYNFQPKMILSSIFFLRVLKCSVSEA